MTHMHIHMIHLQVTYMVINMYIHVSHVQLTYMVINVQDGGGDIYVWELLMCGSSIHV